MAAWNRHAWLRAYEELAEHRLIHKDEKSLELSHYAPAIVMSSGGRRAHTVVSVRFDDLPQDRSRGIKSPKMATLALPDHPLFGRLSARQLTFAGTRVMTRCN
jgi:hypothetical protein